VTLDDAERSKLAKIELELRQDAQMMHAVHSSRASLRGRGSVAVYCATAVFAAALGVLALLTRDPLPILLGLMVVSLVATWWWWLGRRHGRSAGFPGRRDAAGGDGS
jgi:CHASE2 domain-containing sensor protein